MIKVVFFGTPEYVLPILTQVHKKFVTGPGKSPILAVVTQSPKPTGRKQLKTYSPVDKWAFEHKIPVFYSAQELLKENFDADLGILASYSEIISKEVLSLFPQGIINIHPSLLPKLRGASPVQGSIITEEKTGVTIMKMDEKLDHGPIISQFKEDILPNDTTETLRDRLFLRSADVLVELLEPYMSGKIKLKPQDENAATFTRKIVKEDGYIEPEIMRALLTKPVDDGKVEIGFIKDYEMDVNPVNVDRFIRAMYPWPIAWSHVLLRGKKDKDPQRIKILKAHVAEITKILEIDEVQLEGKNPVSFKQFKTAYSEFSF